MPGTLHHREQNHFKSVLLFTYAMLPSLCYCDRSHRRPSSTFQLERQADESKFVALIASQLLQEEVFYNIDAMTYQQDHMTGKRYMEFGIDNAHLVPGHIVGSHCPHPSACNPGGRIAVHPSRLQIHSRVLPERAIAGAYQH